MYFYRYPIILTILNGAVSLLGDELLKWNAHSLLAKAICDNLTHAINGILCALIITLRANYPITWNERMLLMQCGGLVASFIDLDHFIVARSVALQRAVAIGVRPFLHNTTIPIVLILLIVPIDGMFASNRLNMFAYVVIGSFLVHHTRDANRRGYWVQPFGSTGPLPTALYVLLIMLIPVLLGYLPNIKSFNNEPPRIYSSYTLHV